MAVLTGDASNAQTLSLKVYGRERSDSPDRGKGGSI